MTAPLLSIRGLTTVFRTEAGVFPAVDDLDLDVRAGEVVGIVGESGSGKSVAALSVAGLIPDPPGRIAAGSVRLEGVELVGLPRSAMARIRGPKIGMIFQEPMTSLNPVFTIGEQIAETLRRHEGASRKAALRKAADLLATVGIASPERRLDSYPHQLSGGMRQRVMIAIALACRPKLLIADEPTTALDVTIQAQILDLLIRLRDDTGMGILIITHNMGVIAEFADRVVVMYAGRKVEEGSVSALFDDPRHPYTIGLLASTPRLTGDQSRLTTVPGFLPGLADRPPGCCFAPRCGRAVPACGERIPPAIAIGADHRAACLRADETGLSRTAPAAIDRANA